MLFFQYNLTWSIFGCGFSFAVWHVLEPSLDPRLHGKWGVAGVKNHKEQVWLYIVYSMLFSYSGLLTRQRCRHGLPCRVAACEWGPILLTTTRFDCSWVMATCAPWRPIPCRIELPNCGFSVWSWIEIAQGLDLNNPKILLLIWLSMIVLWTDAFLSPKLETNLHSPCAVPVVQEGMLQKHLQHRVPREDQANINKINDLRRPVIACHYRHWLRQVKAPRINLTWRWIVPGLISVHAVHKQCSAPNFQQNWPRWSILLAVQRGKKGDCILELYGTFRDFHIWWFCWFCSAAIFTGHLS